MLSRLATAVGAVAEREGRHHDHAIARRCSLYWMHRNAGTPAAIHLLQTGVPHHRTSTRSGNHPGLHRGHMAPLRPAALGPRRPHRHANRPSCSILQHPAASFGNSESWPRSCLPSSAPLHLMTLRSRAIARVLWLPCEYRRHSTARNAPAHPRCRASNAPCIASTQLKTGRPSALTRTHVSFL